MQNQFGGIEIWISPITMKSHSGILKLDRSERWNLKLYFYFLVFPRSTQHL